MQDKAFIDQIANERAHGSPSQLLAWRGALECLPTLPTEERQTVLEVIQTPDTARLFGRFLSREKAPDEGLRYFLKEVDESDESLGEWMKAFEVFAYFLESTAHRPSLSKAIGYLHCCVSIAHTGSNYATFPMAVETMLETYGYTGESD
jgi:hypothetical protein